MKSVQTLIAQARALVHTDRELAARLGVKPPDLSEMKKGNRPISPETVATLCDMLHISGDEAREWVAISLIENPKNSSRVEVLRRVFFSVGMAALATIGLYQADDASAREQGPCKKGEVWIKEHSECALPDPERKRQLEKLLAPGAASAPASSVKKALAKAGQVLASIAVIVAVTLGSLTANGPTAFSRSR